MNRRSNLRASDADREHIADRLRQASTEGRLAAEEFEQRLATLFRAKTYGELDALVADLPRDQQLPQRRRSHVVATLRHVPPPALIFLIPVAMALVVAAVVVVVTLFAVWGLMLTLAWLAFGRHHGHRYPRPFRASPYYAYGGRWRAWPR